MDNKLHCHIASIQDTCIMPSLLASKKMVLIVSVLAGFVSAAYGVTNSYTIIAQTGQNGITSILGGPSINSVGDCAFPVQVSAGQAVYFCANGSGTPVDITSTLAGSTRSYSSFLGINSSDTVVAQDTFSGSPPTYYIRTWDANIQGTYTIDAKAANDTSDLVPSINDLGQIAYLNFDGTSTYYLYVTNTGAAQSYYVQNLGNNLYRPMIADNGSVVGKLGPGPTTSGSIRVYNNNLQSYSDVAIAGSSGQFSALDSLPGISWDGRAVAFNGSISGSQGIFIATADNTGSFSSSLPFLIAGSANGFSSFQSFSKVAVNTTGQAGIITTYSTPLIGNVAYIGTLNGTTGLYMTAFLSQGPAVAPLVINPTPSPVVTVGQSLPNLAGAVQSIAIMDPLTSDGKVTFFVQTTSGAQAIVLATPYTLGIDVSHFQDENAACVSAPIDWSAVQGAGVSFVFVKASEGVTITDGRWPNNSANTAGGCGGQFDDQTAANIAGATSAGLLVAPYHLADVIGNNSIDEARFFLQRASAYIGTGYLPPVLDLESLYFQGTNAATQLLAWATGWLNFVQQATGVTPIVYANTSTMEALINAGLGSQYVQWVAARTTDTDPTATPQAPDGFLFSDWQFKQYESELTTPEGSCAGITGNGGVVDLDSFNGDLTQLTLMTTYPPSVGFASGVNFNPFLPPVNGVFNFQAFSPTAAQVGTVTVQASQDLNNWNNIGTITFGPNGTGTFSDSDAGTVPARFYRFAP